MKVKTMKVKETMIVKETMKVKKTMKVKETMIVKETMKRTMKHVWKKSKTKTELMKMMKIPFLLHVQQVSLVRDVEVSLTDVATTKIARTIRIA